MAWRRWLGLLLIVLTGCSRCGADPNKGGKRDPKGLVDGITRTLEPAKIAAPQDALPPVVQWAISSPDPQAYFTWARQQPFPQRAQKTALYQELARMPSLQHLRRMHGTVAGLAAYAGTEEEALWRGPLAIGIAHAEPSDRSAQWVAIKSIPSEQQTMMQFAAAFAALIDRAQLNEALDIRTSDVDGHPVYTVSRPGDPIVFSLFSDLVIAGNNPDLVARTIQHTRAAERTPFLPPTWASTPGIHIARRGGEVASDVPAAWPDLFLSLRPDPSAPVHLSRPAAHPSTGVTSLGRYVPKAAPMVIADGAFAARDVLGRMTDPPAATAPPGEPEPPLRIAKALADQLKTGAVLAISANDGALEARAVFGHAGRDAIEPQLRALLRAWAADDLVRTQTTDGDTILAIREGPAAGISDDALVFALSDDQVRRSLQAARGTQPSLQDRSGWPKKAPGAILVDFAAAAPLLNDYYAAFLKEDSSEWAELNDDVKQTFDTLATGGALVGTWSVNDGRLGGPLHVY